MNSFNGYCRFVVTLVLLQLVTFTILAEGQLTASFYFDSNCSQSFASSIPYPTYTKWSSLGATDIEKNQTSRVCISPNIPPVSEGSYDCQWPPVLNGSRVLVSGALQVAEWFTPGHCYTDSNFTQPDQSFTASFITANACSPASYRNSSGGLSLYAKVSCPVPSNTAMFSYSPNLLLIIASLFLLPCAYHFVLMWFFSMVGLPSLTLFLCFLLYCEDRPSLLLIVLLDRLVYSC